MVVGVGRSVGRSVPWSAGVTQRGERRARVIRGARLIEERPVASENIRNNLYYDVSFYLYIANELP